MIRKFKPEDIHQVMQIWLDGNVEAHDFIDASYWKSHYDSVQEQLPEAEIYVYEEETEKKEEMQTPAILGFVGMAGDYLAGIFVDRRSRSMGIGKALLDYVKGKHDSFSLNVYQKNEAAVRFYLREGLTISAEGTDEETKEPDYTMTWCGNQGAF